jgi:hypothetical protein
LKDAKRKMQISALHCHGIGYTCLDTTADKKNNLHTQDKLHIPGQFLGIGLQI